MEQLTPLMESLGVTPQAPVQEPEKVEKKNILFDILNALFINKDIIKNLTYESAKQNIFMINRRLAIKYPLQAQLFNRGGMNPKDVVMCWSDFLYAGSVPRWIYTPGAAKTKSSVKDLVNQEPVLKRFRTYYSLSKRELDSCIKLFPAETEAELKAFVKFEKEISKNEETGN